MDTLDLVLRGALIGVGGSALMDAWGWVARRAFRVKGLDYALLGRWIGHLPRGRFSHASIASARPVTGERALGWVGHYSIGVTFAFLLLIVHGRQWTDAPTLWPALLVGWVTVLAPWLILQPGMGAGIAASRTPRPGAARLRNVASHTAYGLGLYASAVALASL